MSSLRSVTFITITALAVGAQASQEYKITVTNLGPQPLSPVFVSASNSSFDIFDVGGTASLGIKHIAEMGNTSFMKAIAAAAGSNVGAYGVTSGGPFGTGGSESIFLTTDAAHPYFSFAAMLGKTNDGFIGESYSSLGLDLFQAGMPHGFSFIVTGQDAWDAGTEQNTQNAADLAFLGGTGNPADSDPFIRVHGGVIPNVGDSWQQMPSWSLDTELARVDVNAVPGPSALSVFGFAGLAAFRRRRTHAKSR